LGGTRNRKKSQTGMREKKRKRSLVARKEDRQGRNESRKKAFGKKGNQEGKNYLPQGEAKIRKKSA